MALLICIILYLVWLAAILVFFRAISIQNDKHDRVSEEWLHERQ